MPAIHLVDVTTADGLLLTGALYPAAPAIAADRCIDAVLMIHGNGSNFHSPYQRDFAGRLAAAGYPVLTANTRGHGYLSMAMRPGRAAPGYVGTTLERIDEGVADLDAWVAHLRARGHTRILVWGHSRGAVKVAYDLAHRPRSEVVRAVLSSPPLLSYERWMRSDKAQEFAALLRACEQKVAAGEPDALIPVTLPVPYISGASQYLDSYGPGDKYNLLRLLDAVTLPVLAITGTEEAQTLFPFIGLPALLDQRATQQPGFRHLSVPDGDHLYSGRRDLVLQQVLAWLESPIPTRPGDTHGS